MGYSLRTIRYRLTWWVKDDLNIHSENYIQSVELYDYDTDPYETVSFEGKPEYKDVQASLSKMMEEFLNQE